MYTLRKILAAIAVAEPREAGITRSVIDAYELMGDDPIEALREDARRLVDILASTLRELQRLGEAQRLFVAPMKTRDEVFTLLESIEEIDDARYLKDGKELLFDNKNDPLQRHDLASDPASPVAALTRPSCRELCDGAWMHDLGERAPHAGNRPAPKWDIKSRLRSWWERMARTAPAKRSRPSWPEAKSSSSRPPSWSARSPKAAENKASLLL